MWSWVKLREAWKRCSLHLECGIWWWVPFCEMPESVERKTSDVSQGGSSESCHVRNVSGTARGQSEGEKTQSLGMKPLGLGLWDLHAVIRRHVISRGGPGFGKALAGKFQVYPRVTVLYPSRSCLKQRSFLGWERPSVEMTEWRGESPLEELKTSDGCLVTKESLMSLLVATSSGCPWRHRRMCWALCWSRLKAPCSFLLLL